MLCIDGSYGEGGGQIVRNALALSLVTGRAVRIEKIRAGRPRPGLRPQHVAAVKTAAAVCGAQFYGAEVGSSEVTIVPGRMRPGDYRFEIGTAGAAALVIQTIMVPLALAEKTSRVTVTGGTHVPFSPCFHYLKNVFGAAISTMGFDITLRLKKWGWYPRGGGIIEAEIRPAPVLRAFKALNPAGPPRVFALSASSRLPEHVRRRQRQKVEKLLISRGIELNAQEYEADSHSPGSLVFLWTSNNNRWGGFTALGARGKPAEQVAEEAARGLLDFLESGACVGTRLADQLVLPALVAAGSSRFSVPRISRHLKTCAWIAEQFGFKKVEMRDKTNPSVIISGKDYHSVSLR